MTTERVIAWLVLVGSVYGSVYAIQDGQTSLIAIFVFMFVLSVWTVLTLTDQPEFGERE